MRFDLRIIASWITPGATVLGLGCGEGDLLLHLKQNKQVKETGIEIVESRVAGCIKKGLSVLQGDINEEILDYPDDAFDYVILSQTLQQVYEPSRLIHDMLRIGKQVIVSFPNFGHWRVRAQVLLTGRTPVTRELPYAWYDTPNIRVLSIKDFRDFVKKMAFHIEKSVAISPGKKQESGKIVTIMPNLLATYGIFQLGKDSGS
ncbi:MAG: methionine biosynthesis protein MetW [Thermodesulfobacteriota bacterium]|nr:methionine biosynthesis protein MetW [Thermodesulfobacteriota bacterium]